MVMATLPTRDFFDALGQELSEQELHQALFSLGMELDSYDENELVVEITPDRLDLLSTQGLARAIKHFLGLASDFPSYRAQHDEEFVVHIADKVKEIRPHTVCVVVKNLQLNDERVKTIIALQEKLHATLGRKRQRGAIGLYPLEKITWPIQYTADAPDEISFIPLEATEKMTARELLANHPTGKQYAHLLADAKEYPYFVDAAGLVLSVPPIINSETTGRVTPQTTEIFIECSGHEVALLEQLLVHLTTAFADMGGTLYAVRVEYTGERDDLTGLLHSHYTPNLSPSSIQFNPLQVKKVLGIDVPPAVILQHLERMMHKVLEKSPQEWEVTSPVFRYDIWHERDIVDDVARSFGYDNITPRLPNVASIGSVLPLSALREELSEILVGLGFLETYTFALTGKEEHLDNMLLDENKVSFVPVINGAENQSLLRISLLPQQLQLLATNRNRPLPQKIFEGDFVVIPDASKDVRSRNEMHVCALITDKVVTFTQIKQVLDAVLSTRGVQVTIKKGSHPSFLAGRVGTVMYGEKAIGVIGELHPQVLLNFGLQSPVAAFEINLEALQ
jgi:phenylalanyl-tRNA synthetase beta chain